MFMCPCVFIPQETAEEEHRKILFPADQTGECGVSVKLQRPTFRYAHSIDESLANDFSPRSQWSSIKVAEYHTHQPSSSRERTEVYPCKRHVQNLAQHCQLGISKDVMKIKLVSPVSCVVYKQSWPEDHTQHGGSVWAGVRHWANETDREWVKECAINLFRDLELQNHSHFCLVILISLCYSRSNLQIFHFLFYRIVVPFVKTCLMVLPSVQTVWKSLTDVFVTPFFQSLGRCFAMINIRLDQQ